MGLREKAKKFTRHVAEASSILVDLYLAGSEDRRREPYEIICLKRYFLSLDQKTTPNTDRGREIKRREKDFSPTRRRSHLLVAASCALDSLKCCSSSPWDAEKIYIFFPSLHTRSLKCFFGNLSWSPLVVADFFERSEEAKDDLWRRLQLFVFFLYFSRHSSCLKKEL